MEHNRQLYIMGNKTMIDRLRKLDVPNPEFVVMDKHGDYCFKSGAKLIRKGKYLWQIHGYTGTDVIEAIAEFEGAKR